MTVFYVLLYYVWRQRYQIKGQSSLSFAFTRTDQAQRGRCPVMMQMPVMILNQGVHL